MVELLPHSDVTSLTSIAERQRVLLLQLAPTLVSLDAFCRQHGLDAVATHLGRAVDVIDDALTAYGPCYPE